jgi:hypothetical protein
MSKNIIFVCNILFVKYKWRMRLTGHGGEDDSIKGFGRKSGRKETTIKTWT